MILHTIRTGRALAGLGLALTLAAPIAPAAASQDAHMPAGAEAAAGVLHVKSGYPLDETIRRIKADIAQKGIMFFADIDQSQLGAGANIAIRPSHLLLFGNPPLGVQFLSANSYAGLDWPVRMLVKQEEDGSVTIAWTDFAYIKDRYALKDRDPQLKMASEVAASIAASAAP